ncbi:sensor histidine kinase [Anabaena cylindrica FACHB-243]|uniref:Circadian input-output histidine kinase CikA n=1 Tax=Anabaena cylindrica (strain ATCC 27899 / PCC 7122) TaxID=272123 RepID=K9ZB36_ANACC|nr:MULTISPECIES: ATP-binding protein [Anabaena]AFZ56391.1 integral membrane sensor signal transduction histidine kinase [Anabaena cylindrica PCC 7122]MBD2418161.1 sensor histidine kinase [Anabaena cylindrica FACHB-243]MBY5282005.1 sensor histidine kinase [Anabaena sp. CCAP 1446/1C]MBY5309277.1 sensor histidine kinase [Anabaena sp. CCAP 1446/1C]MCM2409117.1 ATP-binding protein [Anabaena sp. CCAP 1446/1C]
MPNFQSSFRRILVTKILLLFVPVLLIGEMAALNKARSSLLNTARQNLTESAIHKGEKITDAIAALKTNLLSASQTRVIQSGSSTPAQKFLTQLAQQLPTQIDCIQLKHIQRAEIIASSCGDKTIEQLPLSFNNDEVKITAILPPKPGTTGKRNHQNQLQLVLSVPVYNKRGNLAYALILQTTLHQQIENKTGSLIGSLVVIAEDGTILAHPSLERVGTNIKNYSDAEELQSLVKNAIKGNNDSIKLNLQKNKESIAGYTAIPNPLTQQQQQKWIILAVASVQDALYGLEEIKLILIVLTVGLIGTTLLASFYLAPYLAGPVEELRDYALNIHSHHAAQPIPRNFKIREFNQLAQALDQMVERLKAWAEELEIAWKEAKSANQVKSQFLATTSHELRNPLHIIINCVRLVRDDLCDSREEELEFLKRADDTAIHLLGIINDLLDISKIEAGKLSVVTAPLELRQLLLEVINLQSLNVQQKGLQLKCELGNELLPVKADKGKLKQVLINIIGNATKFTDQGSIIISTDIQQINGSFYVIVSVKDTGIGIDPEQQHKLFRPFVMVGGTSARKFEGTGLGLAISRNLIELMGGKITLESLGSLQGTTVQIILPLIDISLLPNSDKKGDLGNNELKGNSYSNLQEDQSVNIYSSSKGEMNTTPDIQHIAIK